MSSNTVHAATPPSNPGAAELFRRVAAGTALLAAFAAAPAAAQTTFQVNMTGTIFSPKNLTLNQGDSIQFNWIQGFHNVESGVGGVWDGAFISGDPVVVSAPYVLTFDGALLSNFPKANDLYNYYCLVHLPGMTGSAKVNNKSGSVLAYGTANPAKSLYFKAGDARVGRSMTFSVDNTANPSDGPGFALVFGSILPDPAFPAGTPLPGFGMSGPGAPGQLLVNFTPPDPFLTVGPSLWTGSGFPVDFVLPIPNNPNLVGVSLYFQGATYTPSAVDGIGLTNGLRATFGS